MNTHSLTSLHQMNYNEDKYGSSQWIKNVNTLNSKTKTSLPLEPFIISDFSGNLLKWVK